MTDRGKRSKTLNEVNVKRKQFQRIYSYQNQNMTWKKDIKWKVFTLAAISYFNILFLLVFTLI